MRGLLTAITTLTIVPLGRGGRENMVGAMFWFPLVGFAVGVPSAVAAMLGSVWGWTLGGATLAVAVSVILTGGLHIDGFGDVCDALGGHTREKRLEIMKDPRKGSFGVAGITLALVLKIAAIAAIVEYNRNMLEDCLLIAPFIASRSMQVLVMACMPYARRDGGKGREYVDSAGPAHAVLALVLGFALCAAVGQFTGLFVMAVSIVPALAMMVWMKGMFGGITGDLVGATSEVVELTGFSVLVLMAQ